MSNEIVERPDPLVMIQTAIEKGMDIDKLERLFELQRQHSMDMAEIAAGEAIRQFQSQCPVVEKRRDVRKKNNPDGSPGDLLYKFADIDDILEVAQPIMTQCGIAAGFSSKMEGTLLVVTCFIQVGTWSRNFTAPVAVPTIPNANAAQNMAGAFRYGMRLALVGALNIRVRGEDNDANGLMETISPEEIKLIEDRINDLVMAGFKEEQIRRDFLTFVGAESVREIVRDKFTKAIGALDKKVRSKK